MIDARSLAGTHDVLFVTLDTLRYDVACRALADGSIPNLGTWLPNGRWEERHTPGSFTYSAHHAFFAGFLPTPATPGRHPRLFATQFPGSETTTEQTLVFDTETIVEGFASIGYHTVCIGGVGFFNKRTPLGSILPGLFAESHWAVELGVTDPTSTRNQVGVALDVIAKLSPDRRLFLFMNVSAIHQPNYFYRDGASEDSLETQAAALAYVDACLPPLFQRLEQRGTCLCIICSDHGTLYGDDGYIGHRVGHSAVWTVPYAEFILPSDTREHDGSLS